MALTCFHLLENFLPIRQAYIFDLLNELDKLPITNEVWAFKSSNTSIFKYSRIHTFESESLLSKNIIRFRSRLRNRSSYLADYCLNHLQPSKPTVLHAHFLWMMPTATIIKEKTGAPICVTAYGEDELFRAATNGQESENLRTAGETADIILTPSTYLLRIIEGLLNDSSRVKLWHIGVDPSRYCRVVHIQKKSFRILSVGRLIGRKGFDVLIRAIPEILHEVPNAEFQIIGEGEEEQSLRILAKELGVESSLEILPPQNSLIEHYANSDLFVLPSVVMPDGVTEGLGVPLLEAHASSLPVVASNVGGIPEVVISGQTGFLVPQNQPADLANAILKLLNDHDLRQKFGDSGSERIREEFDVVRQSKRLLQIYSGLLMSS